MPLVSLRDLYLAELDDLADAEQQTLAELPEMAAAATSTELRELFQAHVQQTRVHMERIELLLRRLGAKNGERHCHAARGLVEDARRRVGMAEKGDVLDAALIAAAQRIAHFDMAAYGCARTYARTLGDRDGEELLQQTLDETGAIDDRLTGIAERGINQDAGEGELKSHAGQRSHLRYVPAGRIRDFAYREFTVRDPANDDLGRVDGIIVDTRRGRPEYFVIDSRGWFAGQRFVIPVDALRPDMPSAALRTELSRAAIKTYPPFNPEAYAGPERDVDDARGADRDYEPPDWLMTGVWMTEASGFACVPPRAQSDIQGERQDAALRDAAPTTDRRK
jgi:ferritin-like metal-binding protein YciE